MMYTKFNYSPAGSFYNTVINSYLERGRAIYNEHEHEVQDCLAKYITENGNINGTALKEHWFSISKKDVFISHSHDDINRVMAFAGWLHESFGLEAFVDSCSWGYCDKLLKKIDDRYCYDRSRRTYDYDLRNYTTSHVHMMLSTALTEMMDNTECVIFFNTPNSINMSSELEKIKKRKAQTTISPWIYHELSMTTMLEINPPQRASSMLEHSQRVNFAQDSRSMPTFVYDVKKALHGMAVLTDEHLQQWSYCNAHHSNYTNGQSEHPLDALYRIVFPKQA